MVLSQSSLQENARRNKKGIVVNLSNFDNIIINSFPVHKKCDLKFSPKQRLYHGSENLPCFFFLILHSWPCCVRFIGTLAVNKKKLLP